MNVNSWDDTWGTIDWKNDFEDEIKQKIIEFYHAGVDFNMDGLYTFGPGAYEGFCSMPLDFAAAFSTVDVIKLLLDGGADINFTGIDDLTPAYWAAWFGKIENLKYLIERAPADKSSFVNRESKYGAIALNKAAECGHIEAVNVLIENGADVNKQNQDGFTALHRAAQEGQIGAIKTLIKAGADMNIRNRYNGTALCDAIRSNHFEAAKTLIENGADVNVSAPLNVAVVLEQIETVRMLIKNGADVNAQNADGETALHLAAKGDCTEIVEALLEAKADANIQNKKGEIPLHFVAEKNCLEMVKALVMHGSAMDVADNYYGQTPLHRAAEKGCSETIEWLLDAGADINYDDKNGVTPATRAVRSSRIKAARILIERGGFLVGLRPYDYCGDKRLEKLVENARELRTKYGKKQLKDLLRQASKDAQIGPKKKSSQKRKKSASKNQKTR